VLQTDGHDNVAMYTGLPVSDTDVGVDSSESNKSELKSKPNSSKESTISSPVISNPKTEVSDNIS